MTSPRRQHRHSMVLVIGCLALAALLGALFLKKYVGREPAPQQAAPVQAPQEGARAIVLFFAAPDGSGLVREAREIDPCPGVVECAEEVVTELINGPLGDFSPTLPETATFRGITLDGDMLTVDFGRELRDGLTGGSTAEALAVYSVVNSLVANFPTVKRVRFLVEGQGVTTLAGHLDLRDPLEADFLQEQGQQRATAAPAAQGVKR